MTSSSKETKSEVAICRLTPAVTFFEMLPSFDRLPLFVCQILPGGNDDDDDDDNNNDDDDNNKDDDDDDDDDDVDVVAVVVVAVAGGVFCFAEPAVSSRRTKHHVAFAVPGIFARADKDQFAPFAFK